MTRDWRGRRVYFVSDLHAGAGGPADDFGKHASLFSSFLWRLLPTTGCLVLAGDVMELWQFRPSSIVKERSAIGRMFGRLIEEKRLHYCPGNHDEEGAAVPLLAGLEWASPAVTIETDCGRIWAEHGSRFDPWNRNPGWQHRLLLAAAKIAERVSPNADVLDRYRRPADRTGPSRDAKMLAGAHGILAGSGLAGVVLGHTHRGGRWSIPTPAGERPYLNCGAWTETATPGIGIADHGGLRYVAVTGSGAEWRALFRK
jgi:UDP-2,3-diacylglucosamine pyrophosphatase LpxH